MMNNHYMSGTEKIKTIFVDSGTTFTYVSTHIYNIIKTHFNWFCELDTENHCKGTRDFTKKGYLCFSYDEELYSDGPKEYFKSFPILRFLAGSTENQADETTYSINWFPSEYLYRDRTDRYCVAMDVSE